MRAETEMNVMKLAICLPGRAGQPPEAFAAHPVR